MVCLSIQTANILSVYPENRPGSISDSFQEGIISGKEQMSIPFPHSRTVLLSKFAKLSQSKINMQYIICMGLTAQ